MPKVQPQDLFNELARYSADQQVAVVFGLAENLDEDRLARAVGCLLRDEPVLGCRVERSAGRVGFAPADPSQAFAATNAAEAWEAALEVAAMPLAPYDAPLLSVACFRDGTGHALAIRVDHAAADGQGAKRIVSRLAKRYSEDVDAACDDASAASPNRSGVRLLRRFSVGTLYHELRNATPPRPTWGIPRRGDDPGRRRFEIRTVDAERFSALRAWAKQRGATVNDVALTAWYRALFAELQPAEGVPMAINVSFDMRRYLEDGCEIPAAMNLSSTETAMLALVDGEPFETTLSRVVRETARLKEGRPGLGQAVKLELAGHLLSLKRLEGTVVEPMRRGRRAGLSYPFLSNFGVIAEEDVTFGEARTTRALMLGPAGHAPFLMLGVSSYRGELSLAIGYCDGEMSGEAIGRIADSAAADLLGAGLHPADGG